MPDAVAMAPERAAGRPPALDGAAIGSVAAALPARIVLNAEIAARLGVDEEWIFARTGIRERRIAGAGERVADLASAAGERALSAAGIDPLDVDLLLLASTSHERLIPIAAALVAARIGASGAGAIDVDAACSGFVSAIGLAAAQVESGRARTVLVIGADVLSPLTDRDDRKTAALFGDGAGAVLVTRAEGGGRIGPMVLGSDGAHGELITAERERPLIRMQGHDTFRHAVERLSASTVAACEAAGTSLGAIDVFAYHQANARILAAIVERLDLDPLRVVNCIDRYGNTSAATVPLALSTAAEEGLLRAGSRVLMAAFGGGLTWAATVVEWGIGAGDGR